MSINVTQETIDVGILSKENPDGGTQRVRKRRENWLVKEKGRGVQLTEIEECNSGEW